MTLTISPDQMKEASSLAKKIQWDVIRDLERMAKETLATGAEDPATRECVESIQRYVKEQKQHASDVRKFATRP